MVERWATVDGNEAAARIAHLLSEVIAIYPITPASPMGELSDTWSQSGRANLWGTVPEVMEMQSEAGAAGTVHGAVQAGALTTTFTASQGLLLMIPNIYKLAGELTPAVIHVAARSIATHALSIFGDHSDVMAVRQTGAALLCSAGVQEAQDLALVAHASTLSSRVPFLHFFDGFRTSHEESTVSLLDEGTIASIVGDAGVLAHRARSLDPNRPVLRGSAQNPDVFFQGREAANPFHLAVPDIVQGVMDEVGRLTGRAYHLFDYEGDPSAERVVVVMGSGSGTVADAVRHLRDRGERVGVVTVRLYRPFSVEHFLAVLPEGVRRIAVLDRTKEPGAVGEPLYTDVIAALAEGGRAPGRGWDGGVEVIGGRYGLSSKEFTPAMALSVFDELARDEPRRHFTVGIVDDVTHLSLELPAEGWKEPESVVRAVFYGLGSDGTVGANKNSVRILSSPPTRFAQGYFVYDSKKSGSMTVSHLRFGPEPIRAAYLIDRAGFVACHHLGLMDRVDVLAVAQRGATVLLNSPHGADGTWERLPTAVRRQIRELDLSVWVVDAAAVAREAGLGGRTNTVLQTCFFALSGVMETNAAIAAIKESISTTYAKRGEVVLRRNFAAVDAALAGLVRMALPVEDGAELPERPPVTAAAPEFVQRVTAAMIAGRGDLLPVSALPVDGTYPTGTSQFEKRAIASEIPVWDPEICIDCARCALVCPHAAIRLKVYDPASLAGAPEGFPHREPAHDPGRSLTIAVAPDDCTGCGVCVSVCPAKSKEQVRHKAINMAPVEEHAEVERARFDFFLGIPESDRTSLDLATVKGSQAARPLFEFSGACAGCGETPYLKLLTQMFGDRIVVANATGCSSIYGGNLPTTPWARDGEGRGPAWANSLFEDNAEFGLGMRLALDSHAETARRFLVEVAAVSGPEFLALTAAALAPASEGAGAGDPSGNAEAILAGRRATVAGLRRLLAGADAAAASHPRAAHLAGLLDHLVPTDVWIVGGDGWAYDIGFGGVDHVLASGRDVNILVLDTEVYSNTGGQTSKATPRAAIAKFSAGGKRTAKKDLGMIAMDYGGVFVAQVALGANMTQTVKAFHEAAAHRGPSLIIAYSPCIAHGIDMSDMLGHQKMAAETGYWPLYRYSPERDAAGEHGLHLDSRAPSRPFRDFALSEGRFAMLARTNPVAAEELFDQAQGDIDNRWHLYEQMVTVERTARFSGLEDP